MVLGQWRLKLSTRLIPAGYQKSQWLKIPLPRQVCLVACLQSVSDTSLFCAGSGTLFGGEFDGYLEGGEFEGGMEDIEVAREMAGEISNEVSGVKGLSTSKVSEEVQFSNARHHT